MTKNRARKMEIRKNKNAVILLHISAHRGRRFRLIVDAISA